MNEPVTLEEFMGADAAPDPMTDDRLDEIRARCEAATPGPWAARVAEHDGELSCDVIAKGAGNINVADDCRDEDADFIAHAREDVPALLAEVDHRGDIIADLQRRLDLVIADEPTGVYQEGLAAGRKEGAAEIERLTRALKEAQARCTSYSVRCSLETEQQLRSERDEHREAHHALRERGKELLSALQAHRDAAITTSQLRQAERAFAAVINDE